MKDGWKEGEDRVPDSYSLKLIQIKAKPHESVSSFIHACAKRIIHCPPPCGQFPASLKRKNWILQPFEVFSPEKDFLSLYPHGPNKAAALCLTVFLK